MYYMGFTWESFDLGPLTVEQRKWFIGRLNKEITMAHGGENGVEGEGNGDIPTKGAHHNTPDLRQMVGRTKPFNSNPRTQRFT